MAYRLSEAEEAAIRELLGQGLNQRQVARRVGRSRGVVAGIQHGRRPDYAAIRRQRAERENATLWPTGNQVGRCPECGAKCHLPCRECRIKRLPRRRPFGGAEEPLASNLPPDAQARLEALRECKRRLGEPVDISAEITADEADDEGADT